VQTFCGNRIATAPQLFGLSLTLDLLGREKRNEHPTTNFDKMKCFFGVMLWLAGLSAAMGQSSLSVDGIQEVMAFYGQSEAEVLSSDVWSAEAFLVSDAVRILKNPGKPVSKWQELPGGSEASLAQRILASDFRPIPGEFLWLQTIEGWYVVVPSKERFDIALNRKKNIQK
jgi:hypothetical protein